MPSHRGHQKKVEKQKKKRLAVQRSARASAAPEGKNALLRLGASSPFGPVFMTSSWRDDSTSPPALVNVIVTRKLPDGTFLVMSQLVDRTFFGVKSAFVRPMASGELDALLGQVEDIYGDTLEEVSVLEAQSVVYHALDFAHSLGLAPDSDFAPELLGPRPEVLLDTPLARPEKPVYVAGPDDDRRAVVRALAAHGMPSEPSEPGESDAAAQHDD